MRVPANPGLQGPHTCTSRLLPCIVRTLRALPPLMPKLLEVVRTSVSATSPLLWFTALRHPVSPHQGHLSPGHCATPCDQTQRSVLSPHLPWISCDHQSLLSLSSEAALLPLVSSCLWGRASCPPLGCCPPWTPVFLRDPPTSPLPCSFYCPHPRPPTVLSHPVVMFNCRLQCRPLFELQTSPPGCSRGFKAKENQPLKFTMRDLNPFLSPQPLPPPSLPWSVGHLVTVRAV